MSKPQAKLLNINFLGSVNLRTYVYLLTLKHLNVSLNNIYIHILEDETLASQLMQQTESQIEKYWQGNVNIEGFEYETDGVSSFISLCEHFNVKFVSAKSINAAISQISLTASDWVIFSAKGILSEKSVEKMTFIHFHPGKLPEYRGSTTLYYTMLAKQPLTVTGFKMAKGIDTGDILISNAFPLPNLGTLDFDYVIDPGLRAVTMARFLQELNNSSSDSSNNSYSPTEKVTEIGRQALPLNAIAQSEQCAKTYYKIHPVLRHLVQQNIKALRK